MSNKKVPFFTVQVQVPLSISFSREQVQALLRGLCLGIFDNTNRFGKIFSEDDSNQLWWLTEQLGKKKWAENMLNQLGTQWAQDMVTKLLDFSAKGLDLRSIESLSYSFNMGDFDALVSDVFFAHHKQTLITFARILQEASHREWLKHKAEEARKAAIKAKKPKISELDQQMIDTLRQKGYRVSRPYGKHVA